MQTFATSVNHECHTDIDEPTAIEGALVPRRGNKITRDHLRACLLEQMQDARRLAIVLGSKPTEIALRRAIISFARRSNMKSGLSKRELLFADQLPFALGEEDASGL